MRFLRSSLSRLVLVLVLVFGLNFSLLGIAKGELAKVNIGVAPYAMYQIWIVAHELGIDKEFGVDFEAEQVLSEIAGATGLIQGGYHITGMAVSGHVMRIQEAPQIKCFSPLGFFKGFMFVGRKGDYKDFSELAAEMGQARAKEYRLKEFEGKSFLTLPYLHPLMADTLGQVGLTLDDVELLTFTDAQKAAAAYIGGAGDIYSPNSLPQVQKLLKMTDKFVYLGGSEILGPAGMWYDLSMATDKWMKENKETALRTLAAKYRTIRLFDQQPEKVAKVGADAISRATGGAFSTEEYIEFQTVYDDFLSIEDTLAGVFNPQSELYWKRPVDFNIKLTVEQGNLDRIVPGEDYYGQSEELFFELLKRKDLLQMIYAPFPED